MRLDEYKFSSATRDADLPLDGFRQKAGGRKPAIRTFDGFGYLSDRIPRKHRAKLRHVADEVIRNSATSVIVVGHALGSTLERKYTLGFRRALRISRGLHDLIRGRKAEIRQYPRIMIASLGDTFPRMGKSAAQDRRVDVIFRLQA